MILILTDKNDLYADRVESILVRNSAEYSRLNLDVDSARHTKFRREDNSFRVESPNGCFSTRQIDTVWNTRARAKQFCFTKDPHDTNYSSLNKTLKGLYSSLESTKWLNFNLDLYSEKQSIQFAISKNIGLKWPSYICANDINYLHSFFETKKDRLLELMEQGCTNKLPESCGGKCAERLESPNLDDHSEVNCPLTDTSFLVRCIVVGNEFFAGKIRGEVNGAGQLINSNSYGNVQPPESIKKKAVQLMTELNLTYGVFDFMVTDNGDWFFDALNLTGKYQWVEDIKGNDISSSIAKWLMMNN